LARTSRLESKDEQQIALTSLTYILSNAARFNVEDKVLVSEMQQLGFPKDSTFALCRAYKQKKEQLVTIFKSQTLRVSQLTDLQWRVDYVLCSSISDQINEPNVQLKFSTSKQTESMTLTIDKFRVLHQELLNARKLMEIN
jgi:hypothetical protein